MNFEELMKKRPHVVILGAGASCAAIPNGDKNGKKISAMNGFIEKLGLSELLSKIVLSSKSTDRVTENPLPGLFLCPKKA